ncbi:MAG TPA: iron ABC transporter permease [Firmicutes bacterium]|jgi:iron complex transport system permease protein|nr:iron ABC transporter permease [Bacillota bacterium]HAA34820.1 iron ABC transporter permease [Bacillota bacterium]
MVKPIGNKKYGLTIAILSCFIIGLFFVSFLIGRYSIHPRTVLDIILSNFIDIEAYWQDDLDLVVMQVRLPRIMLGILVGGALSVSGASYQTLFKNPMAAPDILGVSAGAGFGAALAMLWNSSWWQVQIFAFVFGLIAVTATYLIGSVFSRHEITVLILAGIVVSSFFQALLSIVKTLADTDTQLPSITFWLMGSLGKGTSESVLLMLPALGISLAVLFIFRHHIDALAAGEDVAATMGVNVQLMKTVTVCCSTLMTVSAVSICGIIGWVGMVVPHISRMLTGSSFPRLIVTSFLVGGSFLLIIDNVVRGVKGVELPLGVLTALVGTPVFVILLSRVKKGWS